MQHSSHSINPINNIIPTQQLQQFQCIICLQSSINMLQCKKCHKPLCTKCITDLKKTYNKCPQKCSSSKLTLQPIPNMKIQYRCPFSLQCKQSLKSKKQFMEHDLHCQFINQEQKVEQDKKWNFLCQNNHPLEIIMDSAELITPRKLCSGCGNQQNIRIICRKCNLLYCNICRILPIYQNKCPKNHQFEITKIYNSNFSCYYCGLSSQLIIPYSYSDFFCNFTICKQCYTQIPKFTKQIPYIHNHKNYCDLIGNKKQLLKYQQQQLIKYKQQHRLEIISLRLQKICNLCNLKKLCYKICNKCQKYYCTSCKIFQITNIFSCQLQHKIQIINSIGDQQQQLGKNLSNCFDCGLKYKSQPTNIKYFVDRQCKVSYCYPCLDKLIQKNHWDQRIISSYGYRCQKNHYLLFLPQNKDFIGQCSKCYREWFIKFQCICCQKRYLYCSRCIIPKNYKYCYCNKLLINIQNIDWMKCFKCRSQNQYIFSCKSCNYYLCEDCYYFGKCK